MRQFVDRGAPLEGVERTQRDHRIPFQFARRLSNFRLPDKRAVRRLGFKPHLVGVVKRQVLAKQTPATVTGRLRDEPANVRTSIFKTPLSYGLLRWHDTFQWKTTRDMTVEFRLILGEKEALVEDPFVRKAKGEDHLTNTYDIQLREEGVYVFDQTVLANSLKFITGDVATPGTTVTYDNRTAVSGGFDVFPTTTLAVGYTTTKLFVVIGLVDSTSEVYSLNEVLLEHSLGSSYTVGDEHHVAVVYDSAVGANGSILFYVDGVLATTTNTYAIPNSTLRFIGEHDALNFGNTATSGAPLATVQRDIVLLNECTARASYQSSCKITNLTGHGNQSFFHEYGSGSVDATAPPWACAPPRGTAIFDLRFWHEARTITEVTDNKLVRIETATNLKASYPLDDGGGIFKDVSGAELEKDGTIHHGHPSYVVTKNSMHGVALRVADGQYIVKEIGPRDNVFIEDMHAMLLKCFSHRVEGTVASNEYLIYQEKHSFTIQIEVTMPYTFQQELNDHFNDPADQKDATAAIETRRAMGSSASMDRYKAEDGRAFSGATPNGRHLNAANGWSAGVTPAANEQFPRAYDMTLFSIESSKTPSDNNNNGERWRIPVVKGSINPSGQVVFEMGKMWVDETGGEVFPALYRSVTTTTLTAGKTYVLTFVQRPDFSLTGVEAVSSGFILETWIWDKSAAAPTTPDTTFTENKVGVGGASDFNPHSGMMEHDDNYDIIVGASGVNDSWDRSISSPQQTTIPVIEQEGPWKAEHFMSPYQDQPGFFDISVFRVWAEALTPGGVHDLMQRSIKSEDQGASLIVNLEIDSVTGTRIPNQCRYSTLFETGFKGWGTGQLWQNFTDTATTGAQHIALYAVPGAWMLEDRLGWQHYVNTAYNNLNNHSAFRMLASYKSTLTQDYGMLVVVDDALAFDADIDGNLTAVPVHGSGMLSEFEPGTERYATTIADKTFITSRGGFPKVFDGRLCTRAGFGRFTGGIPNIDVVSGGNLTVDVWYGVRLVYFAQGSALEHLSPVALVKTSGALKKIRISGIPAHPDPRVTSVRVYRTVGLPSKDLARNSPLFADAQGAQVNAYINTFDLEGADNTLLPIIPSFNTTELPLCEFSASLNGRLYLAGDPLIPDVIYFSDPGAPERFDTISNRIILEESTGDKITGIVAAFGSLFVWKANSLWRVDEVGGNQHQVVRIAAVGAASSKSIVWMSLPDTGLVALFFWSKHGPYLFDGTAIQYIGGPIEEQDEEGEANAEFPWLEAESVVTAHMVRSREIVVFYKPKHVTTATPGIRKLQANRTEAVVFNYRYRAWYRYTGMVCNTALAQSFTNTNPADVASDLTADQTAQPSIPVNTVYHTLVGDTNGKIYRMFESREDGTPTADTVSNPYTVLSYSGGLITMSSGTFSANGEYNGLWMAVRRTTNNAWMLLPIRSNSGASGRAFTVDTTYPANGLSFTPAAADEAYICQAPAELEFPWDDLGLPLSDKQIMRLATWSKGQLYYAFARDFDASTLSAWASIANQSNQRKLTVINRKLESIKLYLVTFTQVCRLDSYGYEADPTNSSETLQ